MRILVTGAGGFVGPYLTPLLLDAGHAVVACSRAAFKADSRAELEIFDITDSGQIAAVIERHEPDAVAHLAGQASVPGSWADPAATYAVNIAGTHALLDAVKPRPSVKVLLVGSAQEYGSPQSAGPISEDHPLQPTNPYAVSKVAQEMLGNLYHREFGLDVVCARPFNHTGPGQSAHYAIGAFCSIIAKTEKSPGDPIRVGSLESVRDFLDVRDVVTAYQRLIEEGRPGEAYNVCSGKGWRIGDLLDVLLEASSLTRDYPVEQAAPRKGDPDLLVGDGSKIERDVGWTPRRSIEESVVETLDWYRRRLDEDEGGRKERK